MSQTPPESRLSRPQSAPFRAVQDDRPDDVVWPQMSWPVPAGTVLRGDTVELTPTVPDDAAELYAALDDDRVWQHLAGRPSDVAVLRAALAATDPSIRGQWSVRLVRELGGLSAGTLVGTSSYIEVSAHDARLEIGSTAYTPTVWASAVNPEAKLLLLAYAFDELRAGRVQLKTDVRNERSQRAIERLGARFEGVLRRYQRRADGTVRDTVLFSIAAEEWPDVRAGLISRLRG